MPLTTFALKHVGVMERVTFALKHVGGESNGCAKEGLVLRGERAVAESSHVSGGGGGSPLGEVPVPGHTHLSEVLKSR